jgi:hypothetical protein
VHHLLHGHQGALGGARAAIRAASKLLRQVVAEEKAHAGRVQWADAGSFSGLQGVHRMLLNLQASDCSLTAPLRRYVYAWRRPSCATMCENTC